MHWSAAVLIAQLRTACCCCCWCSCGVAAVSCCLTVVRPTARAAAEPPAVYNNQRITSDCSIPERGEAQESRERDWGDQRSTQYAAKSEAAADIDH